MKIRSVEAELLHADQWTDMMDQSLFALLQICLNVS
jgi:hypothetical protein